MAQRESRRSRQIRKKLSSMGIFNFKVHGSEFMMAGLPDIIACVDGMFVGLETKMPETRHNTSARQDYVHTLIEQSKGYVAIVTTVDEAVEVVCKVRERKVVRKR